jgi:hypothetical protein
LGESDVDYLKAGGLLSYREIEVRSTAKIGEMSDDTRIICLLAYIADTIATLHDKQDFLNKAAEQRARQQLRLEFNRHKLELEARRGKTPSVVSAYLTDQFVRWSAPSDVVRFAAGCFDWGNVFVKPSKSRGKKTIAAWVSWVEAGRHKKQKKGQP